MIASWVLNHFCGLSTQPSTSTISPWTGQGVGAYCSLLYFLTRALLKDQQSHQWTNRRTWPLKRSRVCFWLTNGLAYRQLNCHKSHCRPTDLKFRVYVFSRVLRDSTPRFVRRLDGWLVTLHFFLMFFILWPYFSCPNALVSSNIAPAHPHATGVAVYPALFLYVIPIGPGYNKGRGVTISFRTGGQGHPLFHTQKQKVIQGSHMVSGTQCPA